MKILYLLFAVFFLVLQGAPAEHFLFCRRQGGFCTYGACPSNSRAIGICSRFTFCCKR
uniref:Beta-defensin-like domain-containing protein n=1 Tax=Pelusios castaneus TaxID=367368 RepID=A0A8C8SCK8_9SAUR